MLCGIGISHEKFGPSMILACLGISLVGDRFDHESDRTVVLDILRKTEADHVWPTQKIQRLLTAAWAEE